MQPEEDKEPTKEPSVPWNILDHLPIHHKVCPYCGSEHLISTSIYPLLDPASRPPSSDLLGLQPMFIPINSPIVPKAIQVLMDGCLDCSRLFMRHVMVVEGQIATKAPPSQNRSQRRRDQAGLN